MPLRRQVTGGAILMVDRYNDDRQQWQVLQVGPKVDNIRPGDHVLMPQNFEALYDFTDGVIIADSKTVEAVFSYESDAAVHP